MSVSTIQGGQSSELSGAEKVTKFFKDNMSPEKVQEIRRVVSQYLGYAHLLDVEASVEKSIFPNYDKMIVIKIRNKPERETSPIASGVHCVAQNASIAHAQSGLGTQKALEYEKPTKLEIEREFETQVLERYANNGCRNPRSSEDKTSSFLKAYNHECEVTIRVSIEHVSTGERGIVADLNFLRGTEADISRDVGTMCWMVGSVWWLIEPAVSGVCIFVAGAYGVASVLCVKAYEEVKKWVNTAGETNILAITNQSNETQTSEETNSQATEAQS